MKNIVHIKNSELLVSLIDIAKFSDNKYESVQNLLVKNSGSFAELGLSFSKEYDFKSLRLNEEQTTFLMVLMRNSSKVVRFKLDLVKQFMILKDRLCETNKIQIELVRKDLKVAQSTKMKTYRGGFVSLRKYLVENDIDVTEDFAWHLLEENGAVEWKEVTVTKVSLIDEMMGRQLPGKVIEFNPRALDSVFSDYVELQPTLF